MRVPRKCVAVIASYALLFSQALAGQQRASGTLKVPDGTIIRLSLLDSLSSATNKVDDPVNLEITEEVKIGDLVALPRGATARGHVVEVEPKKRLGRAGKLDFTLDYVKAPDGSNLRLRASSARKGEDKSGTVIVGTVLLSGLFLLMHGKDVEIPKGTAFNAYIDGDREIAMGSHRGATQTTTGAPSRPAEPAPAAGAPTLVLVDPSVTDTGETVEVTNSTLTVRGVVTDPSGIPVVMINANPVSLRPKGPQAASFISDPIKLQKGNNTIEIVATDAAHVQARVTFVAHYTPSVVVPVETVPQTNGRSLTKAEILALLEGGVPSKRVSEIVVDRGIRFAPTDADLKEIRAAGGHDDLVTALHAKSRAHGQ